MGLCCRSGPFGLAHRHKLHFLQEVQDQMSLGWLSQPGPPWWVVLAGRGCDLLGFSFPGQEAPGCWAGWRCLPSVHSLYLSIKPFHHSSVLCSRLRGLSPTACLTSAPMLGWAQGSREEMGAPALFPNATLPALALCLPGPFSSTAGITVMVVCKYGAIISLSKCLPSRACLPGG